tara:strand:- start:1464 stop:2456 length:993 start_codon:yes stop_codon:yes gene_type:complete
MSLKIGVLGCSRVAEKYFFPYILKSKKAKVDFIASRSISKAEDWSRKYACKNFGTYEDLINADLDLIYISLPISMHEEWSIKAANSGKHILCEKSSTISLDSAKNMLNTCKQNNVRILEALAFRFHPQHKKIQKLIQNEIKEIQNFYGIFGFPPPPKNDIRWNNSLGGGVLNDVSCYPACASRLIFETEPLSVSSNIEFDKNSGVDKSVNALISYPAEKIAFISSGFHNYYQSKYSVWGSEGRITTKRAYSVLPNYETSIYLDKNDEITEIKIPPVDQFGLMFDHLCDTIEKNDINKFNFENDLLNQAKLMEALRISNIEKRTVYLSEFS